MKPSRGAPDELGRERARGRDVDRDRLVGALVERRPLGPVVRRPRSRRAPRSTARRISLIGLGQPQRGAPCAPGQSPPVAGVSFIASPVPMPRKTRPRGELGERSRTPGRRPTGGSACMGVSTLVPSSARPRSRRAERAQPRSARRGRGRRVAPGLEVVGDRDGVEAAAPPPRARVEQRAGAELLRGRLVSVSHRR